MAAGPATICCTALPLRRDRLRGRATAPAVRLGAQCIRRIVDPSRSTCNCPGHPMKNSIATLHMEEIMRNTLMFAALLALGANAAIAAPSCPLSYGSTDSAKSHKLFLYFPAADDATYPANFAGESPARRFDVPDLTNGIGTTAQLRDRIHDVVVDDFCE